MDADDRVRAALAQEEAHRGVAGMKTLQQQVGGSIGDDEEWSRQLEQTMRDDADARGTPVKKRKLDADDGAERSVTREHQGTKCKSR